jgi:hypothetical protein
MFPKMLICSSCKLSSSNSAHFADGASSYFERVYRRTAGVTGGSTGRGISIIWMLLLSRQSIIRWVIAIENVIFCRALVTLHRLSFL